MMLLDDFHRECARLLKLIHYSLNTPGTEKTDVLTAASGLSRMTSPDPAFTRVAHRCANACLLWGYYGTADDTQALYDSAYKLLKASESILEHRP
jgi:hypothetical protein